MGNREAWCCLEAPSSFDEVTCITAIDFFFLYIYFIYVVFLRELSSCGSESSEKSTFHDVLVNRYFRKIMLKLQMYNCCIKNIIIVNSRN